MTDRLTSLQRSILMSGIKSKDTRFELEFITLLKKKTRRKIETHARDIKGTPDIIFRKEKICVFLDSDFWHGWHFSQWKDKLKNDFWRNKIDRNRTRDKKITQQLRRSGWIVLRFWEHQVKKDHDQSLNKIIRFLGS